MCATHAVLQQAWREGLKLSLVLNKMDRLILELQMTPQEAFIHITNIISEINIIINSFIAFDRMTQDDSCGDDEISDKNDSAMLNTDSNLEKEHLFDPRQCNVIFASAKHCWAFHLGQFATMLSASLSLRRDILLKCLWGKVLFQPKRKENFKERTRKFTTNVCGISTGKFVENL